MLLIIWDENRVILKNCNYSIFIGFIAFDGVLFCKKSHRMLFVAVYLIPFKVES